VTRTRRRTAALAIGSLMTGAALALGTAVLASAAGPDRHPAPLAPVRPRTTVAPGDAENVAGGDISQDVPGVLATHDLRQPLQEPLKQIWLANQPSGSGAAISLRFLQALQRHDDLAADRELYSVDRQYFAFEGLRALRRAMQEVRHNAGLEHAARCTDAIRLNREAALVRCGRLRVVVHVLHDELASGVQIGDWSYHRDVYRGPHTHAITPNLP
jgi:hypothetical protein